MKKIETWAIVCKNYQNGNETYYFEDFDSASQSFDRMKEKYKDMDEFECDAYSFEYFDSNYNEFSTYIRLIRTKINIYNKVIDI